MGGHGIDRGLWILAPASRQRGVERDLLCTVGIVADDEWDPERLSRSDLRFGREQVCEVLNAMRRPERVIESPRPAEFERES